MEPNDQPGGDVLDALAAQRQELADLVVDLDDDGLVLPSRCPGWSVADVLLHLAQTDELAVASLAGTFVEAALALVPTPEAGTDVDEWAEVAVVAQRTAPSEVRDRWLTASAAQLAAFRSADLDARVAWVSGALAARTLATTRLTECWIHTGDVAVALGPPPPPTNRLWHTCRLAWRTVPYAFARAGRPAPGPVRFDLVAPDGSDWTFGEDEPTDPEVTTVVGPAADLCEVAGQRVMVGATSLAATGPDADAVLELVRTFA